MLTRCSTFFFQIFFFKEKCNPKHHCKTFVFRVLEKKKKNPKHSFFLVLVKEGPLLKSSFIHILSRIA